MLQQRRFNGGQRLPDPIHSRIGEGATCPSQRIQCRAAFDASKYFSQDLVYAEAMMHDGDPGQWTTKESDGKWEFWPRGSRF